MQCPKCGGTKTGPHLRGCTQEDRFWARVDKSGGPDACWRWQGAKHPFGYGQIRLSKIRMAFAHRMSWEYANGPIPSGLAVLHDCDNPPCVNPAHLRTGTQRENMHDMTSRGRRRNATPTLKTHCVHGHEYTEENTYRSKDGKRTCRACHRTHELARKRRERAA